MRIAVIGGSGFLGSSLCRILKNNEKHFVNYDINKSSDFPDDHEYFSVENKNSDFKSSFNAIINLAAIHRDDERKEDYHKVNVEGVL